MVRTLSWRVKDRQLGSHRRTQASVPRAISGAAYEQRCPATILQAAKERAHLRTRPPEGPGVSRRTRDERPPPYRERSRVAFRLEGQRRALRPQTFALQPLVPIPSSRVSIPPRHRGDI